MANPPKSPDLGDVPQMSKDSIVAYAERYAVPVVSIRRAKLYLDLMIKYKRKRGILCLIGHAGLGKTQIIHQAGRENNIRVVDIRTSSFSLMGAGVPQRADEKTGMFQIAIPDYFPKPGEQCIVFFDEVNQGQQHALNMLFPLLEDRRLFNYQLPDEAILVLAMNPSGAQYAVSKIETNRALNRRIKKICVVSNYSDWMRHAESDAFHHGDFPEGRPCHPAVRHYLETANTQLYTEKEADLNQQFACPATWQTVSLDLYNLEESKIPLHGEEAEELIGASIGVPLAKSVCDYIRDNEVRIAPETILKDYKAKSDIRKRVQAKINQPGGGIMEVCENLVVYLYDRKPQPPTVASQLVHFLYDLPDETMMAVYQVMAATAKSGDQTQQRDNHEYTKKLTEALQTEPKWEEINRRLEEAHESFEQGLKNEKTAARDPMAK